MSRRRTCTSITVLLGMAAGIAAAQAPVRRLATVDALYEYPGYYHLQNVLLHGELVESGTGAALRGGDREIRVLLNDAPMRSGLVEVRGQLFDVGRMEPGDPRLGSSAAAADPERWPRPGEDLLLNVTSVAEAELAVSPSIRGLALQPWRFDGQHVTVVGQFRGRNLFGDLPSTPAASPYDFVLRSADAAIWVTGLRPRGRDFNLAVDARVDTGRWLEVAGTVSRQRGLVTIEGKTVTVTTAPEAPEPDREPETAAVVPGEVIFSSPTEGEAAVATATTVRLQFSRGLDPASLKERIRVGYVDGPSDAPEPTFTHTYDLGTRAVEIRFAQPLEQFRTVRVEVLEGVTTFDAAPVRPWTLTFSTAGQ